MTSGKSDMKFNILDSNSALNPNPNRYDSRLVEYHINYGHMTKEEYESHLQNLPDDSANATTLSLDGGESSNTEHH